MESFGDLLLCCRRSDIQGAVQAVPVKALRLVWVDYRSYSRSYSGRLYRGHCSNGNPEVTICESGACMRARSFTGGTPAARFERVRAASVAKGYVAAPHNHSVLHHLGAQSADVFWRECARWLWNFVTCLSAWKESLYQRRRADMGRRPCRAALHGCIRVRRGDSVRARNRDAELARRLWLL